MAQGNTSSVAFAYRRKGLPASKAKLSYFGSLSAVAIRPSTGSWSLDCSRWLRM
jgi:cytolysin (calcineurin-like family phosphatase)